MPPRAGDEALEPYKEADKRFPAYVAEFGTDDCWEFDALDPTFVDRLLREEIAAMIDQRKWRRAVERQKKNSKILDKVAREWDVVARRYSP